MIFNLESRKVLASDPLSVLHFREKVRGIGNAAIRSGRHDALVFENCSIFWNTSLHRKSDVIFLDGADRVLRQYEHVRGVRPLRCKRAHTVLVLLPGALRKSSTNIGDHLIFRAEPDEANSPALLTAAPLID